MFVIFTEPQSALRFGKGNFWIRPQLVRFTPVLAVLVSALVLAMIAWGAAEIWGESIDTDPKPTASTVLDPINAQPHGAGTFDNNPAGGGSRPPEATDRDPTPEGNGGGPTMITTPSGTEKIR
jgi:hypothetical protein